MRLFTTMMQFIYNRAKKDKKRIINELCFIILHIIVKKADNIVKKWPVTRTPSLLQFEFHQPHRDAGGAFQLLRTVDVSIMEDHLVGIDDQIVFVTDEMTFADKRAAILINPYVELVVALILRNLKEKQIAV